MRENSILMILKHLNFGFDRSKIDTKSVLVKLQNVITAARNFKPYEILKSEKDFIKLFNKLSPKYSEAQIFNTDQMGIEKEQYSTRTLSFQGERKTFGVVKSKNATTHSYTIQPIISLDGQLVGPLYLCLQEPNGKMGETVKKRLFQPSNVIITCSKSGKLTTSLVRYWCDNCLIPSIDKNVFFYLIHIRGKMIRRFMKILNQIG